MVLYYKVIVLKEESATFFLPVHRNSCCDANNISQEICVLFRTSQNILEFCKIMWTLQTWFLQWVNLTVKFTQLKTVVNLDSEFSLVLLEAGLKFMDSGPSLWNSITD